MAKTWTETRYCVYQRRRGPQVSLFSSTDEGEARARAEYFETRPKYPLKVKIKVEVRHLEQGPRILGL